MNLCLQLKAVKTFLGRTYKRLVLNTLIQVAISGKTGFWRILKIKWQKSRKDWFIKIVSQK